MEGNGKKFRKKEKRYDKWERKNEEVVEVDSKVLEKGGKWIMWKRKCAEIVEKGRLRKFWSK